LGASAAATRPVAVPWYVWCATLAVTSAVVGVHWDISWHRSIGRDTFWTAPHIAIYMCGVLAGAGFGYLIFATTFARQSPLAGAAVRVWGLKAPLGAFVAAWGGVAMLTSAPFDDWWHNTYGLDVKILSPPHTVLALGILSVQLGALVLILGFMNRARAEGVYRALFLYLGGTTIILLETFVLEYSGRSTQHSAQFYLVQAIVVPLSLVAVAEAAGSRMGATVVAGLYMLFYAGLVWVLPLFPAEPKLGPVYTPVTHFVPPPFPILLLAPALAIDLARERTRGWASYARALLFGVLFVGVLVAAEWPFANFLMSPASGNRFFGTHYFGYNAHPSWADVRGTFHPLEASRGQMAVRFAEALLTAVAFSRVGLAWGRWMQALRR
jgi:hypothetical protein